ncbi:MAG: GyrI-like domain-containing protein [Desulfitobacteriia bacterium]
MSIFGSRRKLEPEIVFLEEPIKLAGFAVKTSVKTVFKDIPRLGEKFHLYKQAKGIPNQTEPKIFVVLSRNFDKKNQSWECVMANMVKDFEQVPDDLNPYKIPAGKYAIFTVRPKYKPFEGLTIKRTKDYITKEWVKNSGYELTGLDFEYYNESEMDKRRPEVKLYYGIKEKRV